MGIKQTLISKIRKIMGTESIDSSAMCQRLRSLGMTIGEGTTFYNPKTTIVDEQNAYLVDIGKNVRITSGVVILTHDYSWSVLTGTTGNCFGGVSPVKIGNNVFIGINAVILRGSVIEDNVIIGAGSIVSGKCEANSVYAGNPAKRICSLEDFYKKRKKQIVDEAKTICRIYYEKTGQRPGIQQLREYQFLFKQEIDDDMKKHIEPTGYYSLAEAYLKSHTPVFESMDALIDASL